MQVVRGPGLWLAMLCVLSLCAPVRAAQGTQTATVTGVVRDTSEAVVPGAAVEIRNHATNQRWQTVTDLRGRFRLLYLPVGEYHLSVQIAGFTTANTNLTLGYTTQDPEGKAPALQLSRNLAARIRRSSARWSLVSTGPASRRCRNSRWLSDSFSAADSAASSASGVTPTPKVCSAAVTSPWRFGAAALWALRFLAG